MHQRIIPNLWFDGQAEEAAEFSTGGREGPCGWLEDRYGVSWQVVPQGMDAVFSDPDPERADRAMQAMLQMRKLDVGVDPALFTP